ncbi:TIGR03643 family protein [Halomonas vilamensis]|uniref:TIGR03643 family protein n=1 Tax=Vreelandella vilamensis TaxID=531309 RepID=A0ABU1H221_9GAMM|nr:TIGR03643 family protein [Halomonas vilamensis]MDR5897702.1 TIGR03643 family protein [Halomonas vilamensis]
MPNAAIKRFRRLPDDEQSRLIEMAWEDRTPFDAIETLFEFNESDVIQVMRHQLKPSSFRLWRQRVSGRNTKHRALRSPDVIRGYCPTQYKR